MSIIFNIYLFLYFILFFDQNFEIWILRTHWNSHDLDLQIKIHLKSKKLLCFVSQFRKLCFQQILFAFQMVINDDLFFNIVEQLVPNEICVLNTIGDCSVSCLKLINYMLHLSQITIVQHESLKIFIVALGSFFFFFFLVSCFL